MQNKIIFSYCYGKACKRQTAQASGVRAYMSLSHTHVVTSQSSADSQNTPHQQAIHGSDKQLVVAVGHEQQERGSGHLLLFPFLAQGHLIPFLNLAKRLESLGQRGGSGHRRLAITIVSTPRNVASLKPPARAAGRIFHRLRRAAVLAVGPWPATRRRERRRRAPPCLPNFHLRDGAAPAVIREAPD